MGMSMNRYFGDVSSDKAAVRQIETMLYAPGASGTPESCAANTSRATALMTSLSSSAKRDAQYYIDDFRGTCSKAPRPENPVPATTSKKMWLIPVGAIIILVAGYLVMNRAK